MPAEIAEVHTFTARIDCRYLLHVPDLVDGKTVLALTLHGYGSHPEAMLDLTSALLGKRHIVASLQGPHQHYGGMLGVNASPVYNWGIRDHWESAVRLHHEMILQVLASLRSRFQIPNSRCLLAGFSQPVGLNYRFAGTHPDQVGGVLALCGGVPKDWDQDKYQTVRSPILHISRDQDEFYSLEQIAEFPEQLKMHASDVEFHLMPGPHRFPSKADGIVRPWLERVFTGPSPSSRNK